MKRKTIIFFLATLLAAAPAIADCPQANKGMTKEKYRSDLEQFIVVEAVLTPQEAAEFFPLFDELYRKQRELFDEMKRIDRQNMTSDSDCEEAIRRKDKLDIDVKMLQQTYHNKFLTILPASKVMKILKAEDQFNHRMLKGWGKENGPKPDEHKPDKGAPQPKK